MIHFVLGGARSGKSSYAEQQLLALARQLSANPVYIATATAIDSEMNSRIVAHQKDRGDQWQLLECPEELSQLIKTLVQDKKAGDGEQKVYLVDCLTLWLNNKIYRYQQQHLNYQQIQQQLQQDIDDLLGVLVTSNLTLVFVSNEVGYGIVPMGETSRLFVDYCGWLNQGIAKIADKVTLVTAGIPLVIKPMVGRDDSH